MKLTTYKRLLVFVVSLWIINVPAILITGNDIIEISLMIILLSGLFFLFNAVFDIFNVTPGRSYLLLYTSLTIVKIILVILLAWLFLHPASENIKSEAMFFLFNYFALFVYDIFFRTRYLNKNIH